MAVRSPILLAAALCAVSGCLATPAEVPEAPAFREVPKAGAAPRYRITDLGALGPWAVYGSVEVNERGEVAGSRQFPAISPNNHAFVWKDGRFTVIRALPGDVSSYAMDINDRGQVLVLAQAPSGVGTMCLWEGGRSRDLKWSAENARMNNRGEVAGWRHSKAHPFGYAFVWSPGRGVREIPGMRSATGISDDGWASGTLYRGVGHGATPQGAAIWRGSGRPALLPLPPGYGYGDVAGTNGRGDFAGFVATVGGEKKPAVAAVWPGSGKPYLLPAPEGFDGLIAVSLDEQSAHVVGYGWLSDAPADTFRAVLWLDGGGAFDLNALVVPKGSGWLLETATDVNDAGVIVGRGTLNGRKHLFALHPL